MFTSPLRAYWTSGTSLLGSLAIPDRIEPPLTWHALQLVLPPVLEANRRARHEVPHGRRHEYLTRLCERGDPRARRNCDASELAVDALALSGVQSGADLEVEC